MIAFVPVILGVFIGLFMWLFLFWILSFRYKSKIPEIYSQAKFWFPLKYILMRFALWLRKRQNGKRQNDPKASNRNAGYGIKSRNSAEEMDQLQPLPESEPLAVDAVYFNGGNKDGIFIVAATARRQENVVQTVLYLKLPNVGLLELPSLPDTWLTDKRSDKAFTAAGLTLTLVKEMEQWSLSYDGPCRIAETKENVSVKFDLLWTATTKYFDFDTDLHPHTMAESIARETWSREYFDTLKRAHQTHYEQFGEITGVVHIEGCPDQEIKVYGVRDHSYGNIRDWKYFHRYAINYAYLEDGTALCIGAISMPISLSRFVIGYVFKPDGTMSPVSSSNFEFYEWGEDGNPPQRLTIKFVAGKNAYNLVCNVVDSSIFYMGKEWDAKIHERFCNYTVNGVKGWGISEWDYRNYAGKDAEMERLGISS